MLRCAPLFESAEIAVWVDRTMEHTQTRTGARLLTECEPARRTALTRRVGRLRWAVSSISKVGSRSRGAIGSGVRPVRKHLPQGAERDKFAGQPSKPVTASDEDTFPRPVVLRGVRTLLAAGEVNLVWIIDGMSHRQREHLAWFDLHSESLVIADVVRVEAVPG